MRHISLMRIHAANGLSPCRHQGDRKNRASEMNKKAAESRRENRSSDAMVVSRRSFFKQLAHARGSGRQPTMNRGRTRPLQSQQFNHRRRHHGAA
jgi:hypothetical protein